MIELYASRMYLLFRLFNQIKINISKTLIKSSIRVKIHEYSFPNSNLEIHSEWDDWAPGSRSLFLLSTLLHFGA